jgi:hypothetical protein
MSVHPRHSFSCSLNYRFNILSRVRVPGWGELRVPHVSSLRHGNDAIRSTRFCTCASTAPAAGTQFFVVCMIAIFVLPPSLEFLSVPIVIITLSLSSLPMVSTVPLPVSTIAVLSPSLAL